MSIVEKAAVGLVITFLAMAFLRLFSTPLKLVLRLLFNAALGLGALWLLQLTSAWHGIHLGLNLFNAFVTGVLGLPGLGMLAVLQWVLHNHSAPRISWQYFSGSKGSSAASFRRYNGWWGCPFLEMGPAVNQRAPASRPAAIWSRRQSRR